MAHSAFVNDLAKLAFDAGIKVMQIYNSAHNVREKNDKTPVTDADLAAERIILDGLKQLDPKTPVISEEATAAGVPPVAGERFYLVDPLDGTREFISRNGEFTINIALIEHGQPVAGVVYAPAVGRIFAGEAGRGSMQASLTEKSDPQSCTWRQVTTRTPPVTGMKAVASRSHRDEKTDAWLADHKVTDLVSAGSSLKFCLIAAGEADVYPRFGRTMEWDTAAGHAVLAAAGGRVMSVDGPALTYGKRERGFDNPGFIAWAK